MNRLILINKSKFHYKNSVTVDELHAIEYKCVLQNCVLQADWCVIKIHSDNANT